MARIIIFCFSPTMLTYIRYITHSLSDLYPFWGPDGRYTSHQGYDRDFFFLAESYDHFVMS